MWLVGQTFLTPALEQAPKLAELMRLQVSRGLLKGASVPHLGPAGWHGNAQGMDAVLAGSRRFQAQPSRWCGYSDCG